MNFSSSLSDGHILVADDCDINLRILLKILKKKGYRVLSAMNGSLAVAQAKEHLPDLVLLDILMPGMSGYDVCKSLKSEERTRDIPVIFISTLNGQLDKDKAFSVGAVDYITKPFQAEEVLFKVKSHLSIRYLHRELADRNTRLEKEIKDRQFAERALQDAYRELESRVKQRTASLAEANARLKAEIIEREQLQAAIEKSKAELMAIYDSAPVIMLLMGEDSRIKKANHLAADIAGCSSHDTAGLCGGDVLKCVHAVASPGGCGLAVDCNKCKLRNAIRASIETGKIHKRLEIKIRVKRQTGEACIWMQLSTVPLQISGEKNVLVCLQDITDNKWTEALLRKSHEELEMRVEQRTLALTKSETRLNKAMKAAEAANIIKGKFLANMSHEIRTPLNAILGFTYLALKTGTDSRQLNYLKKIRSSSHSLVEIINEVLDFSKIEAGKLEVINKPFHLQAILEDITDMFSFQVKQKALQMTVSAGRNVPPTLLGDSLRLKQVLTNLTGNAVKFTKKGMVSVRVSLVKETESSADLHFLVKDTGIGIPAGFIRDIFSPFTQVDDSATREFQGTGLGLAISRQLVTMMGGTIRVESKVGNGSAFSFTLSFRKRDEEGCRTSELPEKNYIFNDKSLKNKRVLLVEDNVINRELMLNLLEHEGVITDIAENGLEAVTSASRFFYDAVLMDLQMPGMKGYEAAGRIRMNESQSGGDTSGSKGNYRVPIIGLTAHAMKGIREKCLEAGMDDYISKPINPDRFFAVLNWWIGKKANENKSPDVLSPLPDAGHSSDEVHSLADAFPGVAVEPALERLRGNVPLLVTLLKKLEKFSGIPDIIRDCIDAGDIKEARDQVHALKGVAGNLSAVTLYQSALDLENRLKEAEEKQDLLAIPGALKAVQSALDQVLDGVFLFEKSGMQPSGLPAESPCSISEGEIRSRITGLYNDLKMYKTSSEERFTAIRPYLPEQEAGEEIQRLEMQVDAYDFDGARETLSAIAEIMKIPLEE